MQTLNRWKIVQGLIAVLWLLGCSTALAIDLDTVNAGEFGGKAERWKREFNPIILKAQVLLDRYHFSRREISGRSGENFKKALVAFGRAEGIRADGKLDA